VVLARSARRHFYRNRVARVWPLHAVTLLGAVALLGDRAAPEVTLANALLLQGWVPDPSWLLQPERCELVAVLRGLLLRHLPGAGRAALPDPLPVLAAPATRGGRRHPRGEHRPARRRRDVPALHQPALHRILDFVLGILLALLVARGRLPRIRLDLAVGLLLPVPSCCCCWVRGSRGSATGRRSSGLYDLAVLPGVCLLLCAAAQLDVAGRPGWLALRPLVWLGECSFALYMTHQLVFTALGRALGPGATAGVVGLLLALPSPPSPTTPWSVPWSAVGARDPRPASAAPQPL
jgi:peptidoglycan/LPS O-acetylase OafA/YrhL